jgi:tetratricopeptide (TPR) repeat protein
MSLRAQRRDHRTLLTPLLLLAASLGGVSPLPAAAAQTPPEPAPWYVFYQRGIQAMVNEQWSEAATQFEQSIKERKPSALSNRTYGMWQVDYVPYHNLGVCYFYLGRDAQALQALKRSEAEESIPQDSPMRQKAQRIRRAIQGSPGKSGDQRDGSSLAEGLSLLLLPGGSGRAVEVFQDLLPGREDDAQMHLFLGLAYSRNASQIKSEEDAGFWINLARTEFRRVRQLNPRLKLPEGFFSPDIEKLFKEATVR